MAQCPNCSQTIQVQSEQLGTLFRCSSCQSEFFIGFDGIPENSKESLPLEDLSVKVDASSAFNPLLSQDLNLNSLNDSLINPSQTQNETYNNNLFEIGQTRSESSSETVTSDPMPMSPPMTSVTPQVSLNLDMNTETVKVSDPIPPSRTSDGFTQVAQEINAFGNDNNLVSNLSYDIIISGVDLAHQTQTLMEALEDKRFNWGHQGMRDRLKNGTITLENVAAPKAIVLIKRLLGLGLNLSWRQRVSVR